MSTDAQDTLAERPYWEGVHKSSTLDYQADRIRFKEIFREVLRPGMSCLEVGCFPGRYMVFLARDLGCRVSGIDWTSEFEAVPAFLNRNGVVAERLLNKDFVDCASDVEYDFVYSLGFIEHFANFDQVIVKHTRFVRRNGLLFLACPNFHGLQWLLRRLLDPRDLERHYLPAIDRLAWRRILHATGMTVLRDGYYGTFRFWTSQDQRPRFSQRLVSLITRLGRRFDARVNLPNSLTSPYVYSLSRKDK